MSQEKINEIYCLKNYSLTNNIDRIGGDSMNDKQIKTILKEKTTTAAIKTLEYDLILRVKLKKRKFSEFKN